MIWIPLNHRTLLHAIEHCSSTFLLVLRNTTVEEMSSRGRAFSSDILVSTSYERQERRFEI